MTGFAGGVLLHPDFGIDKQNKLVRAVHKYASRVLLTLAWVATLSGLKTLVGDDIKSLVLFAVPLVVAGKFSLMWGQSKQQSSMKMTQIISSDDILCIGYYYVRLSYLSAEDVSRYQTKEPEMW